MSALSQSGLVDALGWMLVHSLWQGTLAAAILAIVLLPLRGRASAAFSNLRYIFACATLLAVVAASIATFAIYYPAPPLKLPVDTSFHQVFENPPLSQTSPIHQVSPQPIDFPRLLPMVVALWAVGLCLQFAWQSASMLRIHRKARGEKITDQRWTHALKRIAARLGIRRAVQLVSSRRLDVPAVIGIFRPVIVIPFAMLNETSIDHAQAILAHELAHIRRFDYFANLIQIGIETIFFYHPAVWWISSQIRRERENCCDDIAASVCGRVMCASALVALENRRTLRLFPAASGGSLIYRVRRLLNAPQPRARWSASVATIVVGLACVIAPICWPRTSKGQADSISQPMANLTPPASTMPSALSKEEIDSKIAVYERDVQAYEGELQSAIRNVRDGVDQRVSALQKLSAMRDKLEASLQHLESLDEQKATAQIQSLRIQLKMVNENIVGLVDNLNHLTPLKSEHIFVNVIVNEDGSIGVDGKRQSWQSLRNGLEQKSEGERKNTVLALSAGSADVPIGKFFNAQSEAQRIVSNLDLAYLSLTGITPTTQPEVRSARTAVYYIGGSINRPGVYSLEAFHVSLLQALVAAGGPTIKVAATEPTVTFVRRTQGTDIVLMRNIPYEKVISGQVPAIEIQANDVIYVVEPATTQPQ
jgi:beta-lactamase regulating signal transducer with metallopeptidase domain